MLPEQKFYNQGDIAKLQFRVPFKKSTTLVTIEREGVLEYSIQKLDSKNQIITVPIKGYYAPNIAISALAVRGRIGGVKPTALIDLGKPTYKLGYANIKVGWDPFAFDIKVNPSKQVLEVRETLEVEIGVTTKKKQLPKNTELAVAVVDEGLLELKPNTTWKLLDAMMGERGINVNTSTAQMQVVGRRHYGLKALKPGGGGGSQNTRELFDTLIYWNANVKIDKEGKAKVSFKMNDSISKFRVVAVAMSERNFGTGQASVRTTQDLMLFSGIPPVARQGDYINTEVTVRNTTNAVMDTSISMTTEANKKKTALPKVDVKLNAGEAKTINFPITIPEGINSMLYFIDAKSSTGKTDSVKIEQKVLEVYKETVRMATIFQLEEPISMEVKLPEGAIPNKGGFNILYNKSLVDGVTAVKRYMYNYPYSCLEQLTSKYIATKDRNNWDELMKRLPMYFDRDGFVKYFPSMDWGSPTLTFYLLAISHEARYPIPTDLLNRMLDATVGFVNGTIVRGSYFNNPDTAIRKLNALEALSRYDRAKKEMLDSITFQTNLLPSSAVLDLWNILYKIDNKDARLKQAEQVIRSRLDMQGTSMKFSTEGSDFLYWLMVSPDVNSIRLLHTLMDTNSWKKDMPRLVRGSLTRQRNGAWDLTIANAWGILAVDKFSAKFEKDPVTGSTDVSLNAVKKTFDWKEARGSTYTPWVNEKSGKLSLTHNGTGKPWITVQSIAALPIKEPVSSGYTIQKTITPIETKTKGKYSKGDVIRITLNVTAKSTMTWVVLTDPIPSGSTILGSGLGGDSSSLTKGETSKGYVYPSFIERSMDSYRAYYEYVYGGAWTVEYTVRLNQDGIFNLPQTRVEAMYSPEMFGEFPNEVMKIE